MLNVNNLIGFGSTQGNEPISATYISTYSSTADTTSYTITNANLGTPFSGRRLVIGIVTHFVGNGYNFSGITVGGVAATRVANISGTAALASTSAMFVIEDSINSTANIVIQTAGGTFPGYALAIWSLQNSIAPPATFANASSTGGSTLSSMNIPMTIDKAGVCLAVGRGVGVAGITGFTLHNQYQFESTNAFVSGSKVYTEAQGNINVTITSSTATYLSGAAAFFA